MNEIIHQVGIKSTPQKIYQLLTTDAGLSLWWTHETTGAGEVDSVIEFKFNEVVLQFQVTQLKANEKVVWKHKGTMPESWMGTEIVFQLVETEQQVIVSFCHKNWKESSDFMAHCNTKWAVFLLSLKYLAEKGTGRPFPNDIQIDHS